MSDADLRNKVTTVNGKWDPRIKTLKQELTACEGKLATLGTPVPGQLPPVLSPAQANEKRILEQRLETLAREFNAASRGWLGELLRVTAVKVVGLRDKIPWPTWVGDKGKDFVMKVIDRGGLPITERVTIKKAPGTWRGIAVEYSW